MGICTDVDFTEGVFEGMKELGVSGNQIFVRDVNSSKIIEPHGYVAMGKRVGADVQTLQGKVGEDSDNNFHWADVPDGVIHDKLPFLWPMNIPQSWTLNLAKFKEHTMGVTPCCKNFQGAVASPYQGFCQKWRAVDSLDQTTINPQAKQEVEEYLVRTTAVTMSRCSTSVMNHSIMEPSTKKNLPYLTNPGRTY